jgi:hypothetical protein
MTSSLSPPRYEERLVLFLDFLGFRETIEQSVDDASLLQAIVDAITAMTSLADESDVRSSQQLTQFSDSLVVSYRIDEASAVFWLLNSISFIITNLAVRGFLVRGGVAVGQLYHTDKMILGPGMNRAYELESQYATYPRVIIDQSVFDVASRFHAPQHSPQAELDYINSDLIEDSDGFKFIDYVSFSSVVEITGIEPEEYALYLPKLCAILEEGLRHDSVRVLEKFIWLHAQYANELDSLQQAIESDENSFNEDQIFDHFMGLPDLRSLADEASLRIEAWNLNDSLE